MTAASVNALSERAQDIFRRVVEAYIEQGQPVASRTLAGAGGVNLSPASIRNVLQNLEERGLLASPHTSAGRVPTDDGLRMFVDALMHVEEPSAETRAQIEAQLQPGIVEDALSAASAALSGLSSCAGIVLVPKQERVLRQLAFVPLSAVQALAVIVGQDGSVENRVLDLPRPTPATVLTELGNYLTAHFGGRTLSDAARAMKQSLAEGQLRLDAAARALIDAGLADWANDGGRPVLIVRGQANLIDERASGDIERVRLLLEELEAQREIAALLENACGAAATRIFIGSENKLFALSGSSVIAAPWHGRDGRVVGIVGVIGPTRLNYARIVPMVDFTAQTLTRLMT